MVYDLACADFPKVALARIGVQLLSNRIYIPPQWCDTMAQNCSTDIELKIREKCIDALIRNKEKLPFQIDVPGCAISLEAKIEENDWNYVFRAKMGADVSHTLKLIHAEHYVRVLGQDNGLDICRLETEQKAFSKFNTISPGCVPRIYFMDAESNTLVVEDTNDMHIMKVALLNGLFDLNKAEMIGNAIAHIHEQTHENKIGLDRLRDLEQEFRDDAKLDMCRQYFFVKTFTPKGLVNEQTERVVERLDMVHNDEIVLNAVQNMMRVFIDCKECLINGDLHGGAVWTDGERVMFTSAQLSRVGPASFDIGQLVASYIIAYYRHNATPTHYYDQYRKFSYTIIDACKATVVAYMTEASHMKEASEEYRKLFMTEVAGFAGCEIVRRIVGALHDKELDGYQFAEEDAIGAGVRLLQGYKRIFSVDFLLNVALMLT